jgi:hypothetical protein
MIEKNIAVSNDPKYNMKYKLKRYLLKKINEYELEHNTINRLGRPKSNLSFEVTLDAIFLCSR